MHEYNSSESQALDTFSLNCRYIDNAGETFLGPVIKGKGG